METLKDILAWLVGIGLVAALPVLAIVGSHLDFPTR